MNSNPNKYRKPRIDWVMIVISIILLAACVAALNDIFDKEYSLPTHHRKAIK